MLERLDYTLARALTGNAFHLPTHLHNSLESPAKFGFASPTIKS